MPDEKAVSNDAAEMSTSNLRKLSLQAPIGRATLDQKLRFLYVNPTLARISGKPERAHLGRPVRKILPFMSPALDHVLQKVIRTGDQVFNSRVVGRRRGSDDWLVSCLPVRHAGQLPQIQLIIQTMDKGQWTHSQSRKNRRQFDVLTESAAVMLWECIPDTGCSYVNEHWIKFTGRPLKEQLGDGWLKSLHPQDRRRCKEAFLSAFRTLEPFTMEYRLRRFDGKYRWVIDRGLAWHEPDGRFIGYRGSCQDITERKSAEEALRRSEEFSRVVMRSLRGYVAILDSAGKILMLNEAWRHGTGQEDCFPLINVKVGSNYRTLCQRSAQANDEKGQAILNGLDAVLNGYQNDFSIEYCCDFSSGATWFLMNVVPLRRAGGGAVLSFTDITDQKQQQLEAQNIRTELAHMRRVLTIGELAASLAHELNQPLAAIMTNAQAAVRMLKMSSPDLAEIQQILIDVIADDKRAGEVIRRLRVLLKKKDLELGPLQVNRVVNEVAEILRSDAILRQASIQLDLENDLPLTYGDDVQLQQVLLNLLQNGLDAMIKTPPDQRIITIQTRRDGSAAVRVSVKDRGHGIEKGSLDRIFTPFFTTKTEGLGLGLAVTRSIIESHKGRLWAENNADGGAAFHFTMPTYSGNPKTL